MHIWKNKIVDNFLKDISLKVNIIVQLECELTYYDIAIQFVNCYAIGTSPR